MSVLVLLCVVFLPARPVRGANSATSRGTSAYEKLDRDGLAKALRDLHMSELLEALAAQSGKDINVKAVALLVQAKIDAAMQAKDRAGRDKLLDEAIAGQDKLIKATSRPANDEDTLRHYRFMLERIFTEGITKTTPYIERLSYFQDKPGDAATVANLTKNALVLLDRLLAKLGTLRDDWAGDDERIIIGTIGKLDALVSEARYRGAWIRLYRGMALPKDSPHRDALLHHAIADVVVFANADDNSSGVKFDSLLLSGMCARLLGEWHNAAPYLERAADKEAAARIRLKALFEKAVCFIDQKKFAEASDAIKDFSRRGAALPIQKVAVDMQSALLTSRLLEIRAEAARKNNPAGADKLLGESRKALLVFVEKYPAYRGAFVEIIAAKYEGMDTKEVSPDIKVLLGIREFDKAVQKSARQKGDTPDFSKAEKHFTEVLADERTGDSSRVTALWYMGLIKDGQQRNYEAARYFRELAEKHPADANADKAALYAVKSLQGVLEEKKLTPAELASPGWREFVKEYAHCLAVLVKKHDKNDPKIRSYNYELGMMYDILGRNAEAMDAFGKLDSASELYIPSRFRILSLRAETLFDSTESEAKKRRQAADLIRELRAYSRRARQYAATVAEKQPGRAKEVRGWGGECGMLMAQLTKDILNQPRESVKEAEKTAKEWPDVPGIKRRSREFIIRVLLEDGQTEEAVKQLLALVADDPKGTEDLIAKAIGQIRVRIARLEFLDDKQSQEKLASLRKAYKVFAEKLFKWARDSDLPADQMYGFEQALAAAYDSSDNTDEVKRALNLYERLDKEKPGQAMNVLGLARCYRRLGKKADAMKHYDRLVRGLPEKTAPWWRAQVERLQFAIQICADNAKDLDRVLLQIRVLRHKDPKMGGFKELFNKIERRARDLLNTIERKVDE